MPPFCYLGPRFFTFLLKGLVHFYMQQTLAPILTRIYVDYEQIGEELLISVTTDSHAANMYLINLRIQMQHYLHYNMPLV